MTGAEDGPADEGPPDAGAGGRQPTGRADDEPDASGGDPSDASGGDPSDAGTDDPPDAGADDPTDAGADDPPDAGGAGGEPDAEADDGEPADVEELRRRVEEAYDFDDFGPRDMAEMTAEEWEVAFDSEAWVTGGELLDRVEADLRSRIADREVFAVLERIGGDRPRLVAYSDAGYAIVHADGGVEGEGTVVRDVKPSVALASMPEYEVDDPPAEAGLPAPEEVPEGTGELGNVVLLAIGATLALGGLVLLGAALLGSLGGSTLVAVVAGLVFLGVAVVLLFTVANARLSGRFRAEEYRRRLRAAGVDADERPEFLPIDDAEFED